MGNEDVRNPDSRFVPETGEENVPGDHRLERREVEEKPMRTCDRGPYATSDMSHLQNKPVPRATYTLGLRSIDELLEKDAQREKDGFPRKIKIGRLVKPGGGGKGKVILVPTTVEEKFIHDPRLDQEEEGASGGSGEGREGEVIGEEPLHGEDGAGTGGAGQGEGGRHEIESSAYDLGRILTEKFSLPNLKDKGKKRSITRYTYDLTDRHRGVGQILDKKATLRRILETNINLGRVSREGAVDPASLLASPRDNVFRVLSKERDYESQAMVFFLRDYSGSMTGGPTQVVVSLHVLIYCWLMYQYENRVETRFILHDTEAKEVPDIHTYYNLSVAGGTRVVSAYKLVNDIVDREGLARDYNIYVFHGTDGDDWDKEGKDTVAEVVKMLSFSNRIGITIAAQGTNGGRQTTLENIFKESGLLRERSEGLRLDVIGGSGSEERLIEGIKKLTS